MSDRDLTGYDTDRCRHRKADEEVYEYDAETGRLACASCEPTGARPHGIEYKTSEGYKNMPLTGGEKVWEPYVSLAANVPGWTPYKLVTAAYQSRYLSNSGRLFFNSLDGLVPKDGNNQWDVYEYEPEGVGSEERAVRAGRGERQRGVQARRTYEVPAEAAACSERRRRRGLRRV